MRFITAYLFLLVVVLTPLQAYALSHPTDSSAVLLDVFTVNATVDNAQSHHTIAIWLISGGGIDYVLDVESIWFSTNCGEVSSLTLEEVVDAGADAAIVEGVIRGYPACSLTPFSKNVRVWSVSCAARIGSGCSTVFEACSTDSWSYRTYEVNCTGNSDPIITQKTGMANNCSGACEASYHESNFE